MRRTIPSHRVLRACMLSAVLMAVISTPLLSGCQGEDPDAQKQEPSQSQGTEPMENAGESTGSEPVSDEGGSPNSAPDAASNEQAADSQKNSALEFSSIPTENVITPTQLSEMLETDSAPFVLDVRPVGEYFSYYLKGSRNIPAGRQIDMRYSEIPLDRTVVIVSQDGERVAEVRQTLIDVGYDPEKLLALEGGIGAWRAEGRPFEHTEDLGC